MADLLMAIQEDLFERMKQIVISEGMPVNSKWVDYASLNSALECGQKDFAYFLLDRGCRVNKTTKSAAAITTPLHHAVQLNDMELIIKLLEKKAFIDAVNGDGDTPLHLAVQNQSEEVVDLLLKYGANVNKSRNERHGTPLHVAFESGNTEIIELLLNNGALVNAIRPYDNKTMLHLFVEEMMIWNRDCQRFGTYYIKKLVKLGCNVNAQDLCGNTALHLACSKLRDGIACVKALLKCGADINIENEYRYTPFKQSFHDIYRNNNADSYMILYHHVQKLKALGMKVNPKNERCCAKLLSKKEDCDPDADCFAESSLAREHQQRLDEIAKMKSAKIDECTSLYDVLFESSWKLASYSKNDVFKNIMEAKGFKREYPSYGYMLKLQFQKGLDFTGTEALEIQDCEEEMPQETQAKRRRIP